MYLSLSDGENEAPPPPPDPSAGGTSIRNSSSSKLTSLPALGLKLKKEAISRGRGRTKTAAAASAASAGSAASAAAAPTVKSPPPPGPTISTPTSATQRAAARKASGARRRSSSRSASVDPSGRIATASYVRSSAVPSAPASVPASVPGTGTGKRSSSRQPSSSSVNGIAASSSRSIGSNGSGSNASSARSRSSSVSRSTSKRKAAKSKSKPSPRQSSPPPPSAPNAHAKQAHDAAVARSVAPAPATTSTSTRGCDPPGPMAAVPSATTNQRGGAAPPASSFPGNGTGTTSRRSAKKGGPSASSPGKERIKKRAERERQRQRSASVRSLSLEERTIVEAVQQQRVVAAVSASLMGGGTPPRGAGTGATGGAGSAGSTGATASCASGAVVKSGEESMVDRRHVPVPAKYVNQSPELARKESPAASTKEEEEEKEKPTGPRFVNQSPEMARMVSPEKKSIDIDAAAATTSPALANAAAASITVEMESPEKKSIDIDAAAATTSPASANAAAATSSITVDVEATVGNTEITEVQDCGTDDVSEIQNQGDTIGHNKDTSPSREESASIVASVLSSGPVEEDTQVPVVEAKANQDEDVADGGADTQGNSPTGDESKAGKANEVDEDEDGTPKEFEDAPAKAVESFPTVAADNDGDITDTPEKKETPSSANDDNEHDGDSNNGSSPTVSSWRTVERQLDLDESILEVDDEDEGINKGTAIAAALSLIAASASIETDVSKSQSFESAAEIFAGDEAASAGASPVQLENGWSGTVTLQPSTTVHVDEETPICSNVMHNCAPAEMHDKREEEISDFSEAEVKIEQDEVKSRAVNEDVAGKSTYSVDSMTMAETADEAKRDDNVKIVSIGNIIDNNEEEKVEAKDRVESIPEALSGAGSKRKEGASEDENIMSTPRRKKMSALRVVVGDDTTEGTPVQSHPNVVVPASPSAGELILHFEAKSPKAGLHGFVPPSPRSAANKGDQVAPSPLAEPFRFGAPPSKAPVSPQIIKTPPRHPPSRGNAAGPHATYDYPQRVQSPKWANSLSQSIAKGVCETQQSPRNEQTPGNDTDRILLEMKKMELRTEARMLRMEQHLEKQMRSKFKHLEAQMDERMDEIQAALQVLLAKDITEI